MVKFVLKFCWYYLYYNPHFFLNCLLFPLRSPGQHLQTSGSKCDIRIVCEGKKNTFLTQILQGKEFSWKNFRLRNILYSCTCSSSLINESSMLQHWKSCSTIKHDKRHFTIKLLRDMSVVGILFRFIKNSANQLYSVKKDFHCCVLFTLAGTLLYYFTRFY